jgi:biotin operon repressor
MTDIFDFPGADEMKAEERRQRKPRQDRKAQVPHETVVVEDETLAAGFTMIPNLVFNRTDLSSNAKLTYMGFLFHSWQKGSCFPGQQRLAEELGLSIATIRRATRELQARGLLRVTQRGQGKTNIYTLTKLS